MRKTCERPGCAEAATVVFGMVPEDLMVWMEAIDPADPSSARAGLLCTRHADATVVPLGWTLDDRREQAPRLFRIPQRPAASNRPGDVTARLRRPRPEDWAMALFDDAPASEDAPVADTPATDPAVQEPAIDESVMEPSVADDAVSEETVADGEAVREPWRPRFDRSDDLNGLLQAQSPLLRRAFGVDD